MGGGGCQGVVGIGVLVTWARCVGRACWFLVADISACSAQPRAGDVDVSRMSPWLLRIEMARDMMVDKKLLLSEVGAGGGGRGRPGGGLWADADG